MFDMSILNILFADKVLKKSADMHEHISKSLTLFSGLLAEFYI